MVSGLRRGDIYMEDLGSIVGSRPAKRRPVLVIQSDYLNRSLLKTVLVASLTSQAHVSAHPGNVFIPRDMSGLPKDSVVSMTSLSTINKADLGEPVGRVPEYLMKEIDAGIRLVLDL